MKRNLANLGEFLLGNIQLEKYVVAATTDGLGIMHCALKIHQPKSIIGNIQLHGIKHNK